MRRRRGLWSRPKLHGAGEGAVVYGENGWVLLTNTSWKAYDAAGNLASYTGTTLIEGAVSAESWQAMEYDEFLGLLDEVQP